MEGYSYSGEEILSWRKSNLALGGDQIELDWLLDLGGGLPFSEKQKIFLYPERIFLLQKSLKELNLLWTIHLETKKPLQYIVGKCPWRDFVLEINSDALIPRQETELLIDLALHKIVKTSKGAWADLGTGSGALAIALARELPHWEGHAVDCSQKALSLAKSNLEILCPNSEVNLHLGNWWDPLKNLNNYFDLVLANPPYIPVNELKNLDKSVMNFEPKLALSGGEDGLESCRKLISEGINKLRLGGWLILEHHHDQSESVQKLLIDFGFEEVSWEVDFQGIRRYAMGRRERCE
ncbi:peptide chain release factor N(5)-glutamine methyltransferase [Prochlorococcus sp. MIT 1223]|uniref:peptide chain release factor N(5)-glutamine methyltransferase n=1 Tax=Prochlorococcus sp. MIT 1223 TaxID=3096217 RepID=UPI002A75E883|nr:peptide chain release factor N(5)-glutamine methyltransferase [Prochlorococcus sp. MIT 1223]